MKTSQKVRRLSLAAFTLVELAIVLVIIGLIVGGVLVGRDLISLAATRSMMTQIEQLNAAKYTFRTKYGFLPGDISEPAATSFGFLARGPNQGQGNGDGFVSGYSSLYGDNIGLLPSGEVVMFWVDLSTARLINGTFNTATPTADTNATTPDQVNAFLPQAKIGQKNSIYVYGGCAGYESYACSSTGINYYGVSAVSTIYTNRLQSTPGLTTLQAYGIDSKLDDGMPQAGMITAAYTDGSDGTARQLWASSGATPAAPYTNATAGSADTCFDNNSVAGPQRYSVKQDSAKLNCALSFRFQ